MNKNNSFFEKLDEKYNSLSKGQKKIADYIRNHYDQAAFMTAAKLGETVGVSESTVVRFATQLEYSGYPECQKALAELVRVKLNPSQEMDEFYGGIEQSQILAAVLKADMDRIKNTMECIDHEAFEMAVESIMNARKIYIVGLRSSAPLANFLSFYLNLIRDDVHLVQASGASEVFEQLLRVNGDDVVIGISFPRYSMRTLKALEFANNRNAKVITLTDTIHSPINLYSSCNLVARSDMASIVDSLVAPLSVINALVVALCMKNKEQVINNLAMLEQVWDEYQVYADEELNMISDSIKIFDEKEKTYE